MEKRFEKLQKNGIIFLIKQEFDISACQIIICKFTGVQDNQPQMNTDKHG